MNVSAEFVNYGSFDKMITDYIAVFKSAKKPFTSVLSYWWNWNKEHIYNRTTSGMYEDLTEGYKDFKEDAVGFIYPILKFDGVLEASITGNQSPYSVATIKDDELIMGTVAEKDGIPYPIYLFRSGRSPVVKTKDQLDAFAKIFFATALNEFKKIRKS